MSKILSNQEIYDAEVKASAHISDYRQIALNAMFELSKQLKKKKCKDCEMGKVKEMYMQMQREKVEKETLYPDMPEFQEEALDVAEQRDKEYEEQAMRANAD